MLHRYAALTAAATLLLLIAGALVTSTDSGLAVPDWPLSYGMWFPPMVGGIAYEHGHRMVAGVVGLMILALALWLWKAEPRRWVRWLGYGAAGAVLVQAILGGLTVLLLLPPQVSIAHAVLGQAIFCLVVCLAWCTSPAWREARARFVEDRRWPPLALLGMVAALLAVVQLVLGAVIRHTGSAVSWHVLGAVNLALLAGWIVVRARMVRRLAPSVWTFAWRLAGGVALEAAVGTSVWWQGGAVALRTSHVALGSLVLAQAVVLAWETLRDLAPGVRGWAVRRQGGLADYLALTKPRVSSLVLMTTAVGFWLGMRTAAQLALLLPVCVGTALVVGGANALNQWMERGPDALMQRTRHRPLPAGRMSPEAAFRFGLGLSVAGLALLATLVNVLSACLAASAWAIYLIGYTPMKRRTPLCTLVGAIPGALPPMIGWAGSRGALATEAWALFAILFVWQLPHFLALAVLYRDDYARAGFPMLPLVETGGLATARQTALYGMALVPISLFPTLIGVAGAAYFCGATVLGLAFFLIAARAAWVRSRASAQQLFRASVGYLPVLLGLLAYDRVPLG